METVICLVLEMLTDTTRKVQKAAGNLIRQRKKMRVEGTD